VRGQLGTGSASPGLDLADNAGEVRVQGSIFSGAGGDVSRDRVASPGARIESCARVTLSDCVFRGGSGATDVGPVAHGADGVVETTSSVAAWACEFRGGGGAGVDFDEPLGNPGDGGAGFRASSFGVFAAGSLFQGGAGGWDEDICATTPGDGGAGLVLPAMGSQARLMSATLQGGAAGQSICGGGGSSGAPSVGPAPIQVAGAARFLVGPGVVSDGQPFALDVAGASGDLVWLRLGADAQYAFKPWRKGFDLVDVSWMIDDPLVVPRAGTLATARTLDGWHGGGDRTRLFGQAFVVATSGEIVLGGPLSLVVGP
jgi:hypothetical protein